MKDNHYTRLCGIVCIALLTLVGCEPHQSRSPNTITTSPATTNVDRTPSSTDDTDNKYTPEPIETLHPVHYTSAQIAQIEQMVQSQGIKTSPYVLTESGGTRGVYKLINIGTMGHVVTLHYDNISVLIAANFDDISNLLHAFTGDNKMTMQQSLLLTNGVLAQWWKVTYGDGRIIEFLSMNINNTWTSLIAPASQFVNKSLVQKIAENMQIVCRIQETKNIIITTTEGALSIPDMKIGRVYIGQSLSNIQSIYGKPNIKTILHGNGGPKWEYSKFGFSVGGTNIGWIMVSNGFEGSTPRGIHIGSTEKEVQNAYPSYRMLQDDTQIFVESPDQEYNIDFILRGEKVTGIILADENP